MPLSAYGRSLLLRHRWIRLTEAIFTGELLSLSLIVKKINRNSLKHTAGIYVLKLPSWPLRQTLAPYIIRRAP